MNKKEGGVTKEEMGLSLRREMPMAADGAKIGVAMALNLDNQSRVKRVGLRAVAPLAGATAPALFTRWSF